MKRECRMLRLILMTLLGLTLLRWPLSAAVSAMLPDVSAAPAANYLAAMAQSLLLFALPGWLLMPRWEKPVKAKERMDVRVKGVTAVLLCRAVVTPLQKWLTALLELEAAPIYMPPDNLSRVLAILALALVPAVSEELLFRGALLPRLLRCASRRQAAALTTLLFALMHGSLAGLAGHLLSGLVFTLAMLHTGSLSLCVALHALYNLSALVWPETPWMVPAIGALLLAHALWWLIRKVPKGRERRLQEAEGLLTAATLLVMALQYLM